ncbi:MAG: glycosyltransferase family 87 protein [Nitrospiraceae bacterium]
MLIGTRSGRWVWVLVVAVLLVWGFTDVRRRADLDPHNIGRHQTDLTVYTEAGAAFYDGRDPYTVTNPRGWHYLYPPLFALLIAPLHVLPTSWQGVTWFLLNLLMAAGCLSECRKIAQGIKEAFAGRQPPDRRELPGWIVIAAAAAVLFPLLDTLQRGQVGIAVLLPLLIGFRVISQAQGPFSWFLGGTILAFPVVMKVTPVLPVAILLLQQFISAVRTERSPIAVRRFVHCVSGFAVGMILFLLLVPTILIGWDDNIRHLRTWYTGVVANERLGETHNFDPHSVRNQSLNNAVYRLGNWLADTMTAGPDDRGTSLPTAPPMRFPIEAPIVRTMLAVPLALLALLLIVVAVRWHWESEGTAQVAVFGLACAMSLPLSPISWGHHFVILLPGMLFLPWALCETHRSAARWLAIVAAALSLGHYITLELAGAIAGKLGVLGIGITIWCVVAGAYLLRMKPVHTPDIIASKAMA